MTPTYNYKKTPQAVVKNLTRNSDDIWDWDWDCQTTCWGRLSHLDRWKRDREKDEFMYFLTTTHLSLSLSVCLSLSLRHIFVHTSHAIDFANSIHAVFTWRQPQSMKYLNDFYLIQTTLSNNFAAHQSEAGDKSNPLCNGSLHFNHPHLNNLKVFPWILMAHMRKSSWWESKYWLEVKKKKKKKCDKCD